MIPVGIERKEREYPTIGEQYGRAMTDNPSSADDRSCVERMLAAEFRFMRGNCVEPALLAGAFHPQVVVHEPLSLPYAGDWKGFGGVAALMRKMRDAWSDMAVTDLEIHGSGNRFVLACRLRMAVRATGRSIEQPFAEQLRFEDGKLIEGTPFYFDTAEIAAALSVNA